MKVYLWTQTEGVFLINEHKTMYARPYFVTSPHRTKLLKDRYDPTIMDKVDLLITVTNEELQELVDNAIIRWKPMREWILLGLNYKYIAVAEIKQPPSTE